MFRSEIPRLLTKDARKNCETTHQPKPLYWFALKWLGLKISGWRNKKPKLTVHFGFAKKSKLHNQIGR